MHWINHNSLQNSAEKLWQQIMRIMYFYDIYSCFSYFFILDSDVATIAFINIDNPKNPYVNLDCTDNADFGL